MAARQIGVELLTFVEMQGFSDDWSDLGLGDKDLQALQIMIMLQPDGPPIISGTGGLRKMRFAPAGWATGKSGGARICYVYFKEFGIVLLVIAYSKKERDDIPAGHRKLYRELIERQRKVFEQRAIRGGKKRK
jgi:hypothetical protein